MFEAGVKCVIKEPITSRYMMMLETICGRYLIPVTIGTYDAEAIYQELNKIPTPRPMTHQFISQIISVLDNVVIENAVIDGVKHGVFSAKLNLRNGDVSKSIDCRPSDAVAVALHLKIPVYVKEELIGKSCCIELNGLSGAEEKTLLGIMDDQGTTFWNA